MSPQTQKSSTDGTTASNDSFADTEAGTDGANASIDSVTGTEANN